MPLLIKNGEIVTASERYIYDPNCRGTISAQTHAMNLDYNLQRL